MNKLSFWAGFAPAEPKESRFGLISAGEHNVHIIDVKPMLASQNFKLTDDGKIGALTPKEKFDGAFDQEILAIVFQDEEGRVLIDRRSSIGWLTNDDPKATPALVQQYGLVAVGNRFKNKKGVGVPSKEKSASCTDMASRLFNACEATSLADLMDSELKIIVKEKKNGDKTSNEVVAYYPISHESTTASAPKPANKPVNTPDDDDLPF